MPPGRYDEIGENLGVSAATLRVASFRLRSRFAREVRATATLVFGIPDGPELEAELRAIFSD